MKIHSKPNIVCHFPIQWSIVIAAIVLVLGCASTSVDQRPASKEVDVNTRAVYSAGAKPVTAVLPLTLGLAPKALKQYPQLVEKSVGMGVYQLVLSAITESDHFIVIEIRPENLDAILQERWLQHSGLMSDGETAVAARPLSAVQVIYGRVYDYGESVSETIVGLKDRHTAKIMIGVQLICIDVSSLHQIAIGTAVGYGDSILGATRTAVELARSKMLRRLFIADPADGSQSSGSD
jgi:curli biogenesis system outer membrane secretion channel CsgG